MSDRLYVGWRINQVLAHSASEPGETIHQLECIGFTHDAAVHLVEETAAMTEEERQHGADDSSEPTALQIA